MDAFMMNFVLTGSTGFIGRAVRRRFAEAGISLIAASRSATGAADLHPVDLQRPETLLPADRAGEEFTLVYLAWTMDPRASWSLQSGQLWCLARMLEHWAGRGLRRVVMAGSAAEYGSASGRLRESEAAAPPLSPDGWGKHSACTMVQAWCERTRIPVLWLRPFVVYGSGQQGDMLIPYALRQASAGLPAKFSDGSQVRDFVHVSDVADAFLQACLCDAEGFRAVNIGTGEGTTVADVVNFMRDSIQPRPDFQLGAIERRLGEPAEQVAEIETARSVLDWKPRTRWQHGLRRVVETTYPPQRRSA
jgi:nucleoside-diphosphate-sugar epimerase